MAIQALDDYMDTAVDDSIYNEAGIQERFRERRERYFEVGGAGEKMTPQRPGSDLLIAKFRLVMGSGTRRPKRVCGT